MSYSKNYTFKFMQTNSWHHKLFHFHLFFQIWKAWKGREKKSDMFFFYIFHVFEQKVLMSELCFTFSFNYWYYWSWVVGTANINFVLTMQRKLLHSISPPLCWGIQLSVSNFEKGGLGNLKSSYHKYMHGVLTMLLVKKDFLI